MRKRTVQDRGTSLGIDGAEVTAQDLERYREARQQNRGRLLPQGEAAMMLFYYVSVTVGGLAIFWYLFIHHQWLGLWPP